MVKGSLAVSSWYISATKQKDCTLPYLLVTHSVSNNVELRAQIDKSQCMYKATLEFNCQQYIGDCVLKVNIFDTYANHIISYIYVYCSVIIK